jgi:hypothetical protein
MAPFRFSISAALLLVTVLLPSGDARAITAKDVLEKMTDKERFGYVTGLVDMLSYQSILAGNRTRAECISNAFYGKTEETWQSVMATFGKFSDKAPEGLVVVLMNRACGGS